MIFALAVKANNNYMANFYISSTYEECSSGYNSYNMA